MGEANRRELSATERQAFEAAWTAWMEIMPSERRFDYFFAAGRDCALKWAVQECRHVAANSSSTFAESLANLCATKIEQGQP